MTTPTDLASTWNRTLQSAVCNNCDTAYLLADITPDACPNCLQGTLQPFDDGLENLPTIAPPELIGRFTLKEESVEREFRRFVASIKYPPADLTAENLSQRAVREYLPIWLVDTDVEATWRAQLGFYYDVESFKSEYSNGSWRSQRVIEKKLDWDSRAGRMSRHFSNVKAFALRDHKQLLDPIGDSARKTTPYTADSVANSLIRLPDISQEDGAIKVEHDIRPIAAKLCQEAAGGDQIEKYSWSPDLKSQNWTLLLISNYVSYYLDDDNIPRRVRVHGETGKTAGVRRQSVSYARQRAQRGTLQSLGFMVVVLLLLLVAPLDPELTQFIFIGGLVATIAGVIASMSQFFEAKDLNRRTSLQET